MKIHSLVLSLVSLAACVPALEENVPPTPTPATDAGWVDETPAAPTQRPSSRFAQPPVGAPPSAAEEPRAPAPEYDAPHPAAPGPRAEGRAMNDARATSPSTGVEKSRRNASPSYADRGGRLDAESRSTPAEAEAVGRSGDSMGGAGGGALAQESSRSVLAPKPDDRPGLGTSWGETRESRVTEVAFERDGTRPSYTASLHYNDVRGAYAMAGRDGGANHTQAAIGLGAALTVSLRDEWGNALSAYRGSGRTVAVGAHGQRYSILVRNNTNERFEVVLSVDGLDVLDGLDAGFSKRGYLIEPFATIEIDGFRQSQDAVAAFRFGSVGDSYAAQTGSARNVGVIGVAAFGEVGYSARLRAYQERMYALRMSGVEIDRRVRAEPFPNGYAQPPMQLAR